MGVNGILGQTMSRWEGIGVQHHTWGVHGGNGVVGGSGGMSMAMQAHMGQRPKAQQSACPGGNAHTVIGGGNGEWKRRREEE